MQEILCLSWLLRNRNHGKSNSISVFINTNVYVIWNNVFLDSVLLEADIIHINFLKDYTIDEKI